MTVSALREKLGMSRNELARALGVAELTVSRWETKGQEPNGLPSEVFNAIENAIASGADGKYIGMRLKLGLGALIYYGLCQEPPPKGQEK